MLVSRNWDIGHPSEPSLGEIVTTNNISDKKKPVRKRMTQAERTAISDKRMFQAAIKLINQHGTHNTTLKDIGELAGYSRGLASARFGSKLELLDEVSEKFYTNWSERTRQVIGDKRGIEAIMLAFDLVGVNIGADTDLARASYIVSYETLASNPSKRERLTKRHEDHRQQFAEWLQQAIDRGEAKSDRSPRQFGIEVSAVIFGLVYQWIVDPHALDLEAELGAYLHALLDDIVVPERRGQLIKAAE
ncbi:MAG: TetR/AcrR family transcriptional regulator [Sphingomonadales bacterium]|nr:MAG: TetR/AcrR family transcriptional regulator [Sphingomonadales bacterium]